MRKCKERPEIFFFDEVYSLCGFERHFNNKSVPKSIKTKIVKKERELSRNESHWFRNWTRKRYNRMRLNGRKKVERDLRVSVTKKKTENIAVSEGESADDIEIVGKISYYSTLDKLQQEIWIEIHQDWNRWEWMRHPKQRRIPRCIKNFWKLHNGASVGSWRGLVGQERWMIKVSFLVRKRKTPLMFWSRIKRSTRKKHR